MNISEKDLEKEFTIGRKKSAKPMLWVSMISMVMFFAGLTSAYVISMRRDDWVTFELPDAFYISTVLIILSSITISISQRLIKKEKKAIKTRVSFKYGIKDSTKFDEFIKENVRLSNSIKTTPLIVLLTIKSFLFKYTLII